MIVQGGFTFTTLFGLIIPVIGVTYLFSLYNLYIGRNPQKHKYIVLGLNFAFLFVYIVLLFNIPEYNHIRLIVLLILILGIIVLGIVGGFMYEQERSRNYIDKYAHITKKLTLILKFTYGFVGVVFVTFLSYTLLTHEIQVVNRISYHYDCLLMIQNLSLNQSHTRIHNLTEILALAVHRLLQYTRYYNFHSVEILQY